MKTKHYKGQWPYRVAQVWSQKPGLMRARDNAGRDYTILPKNPLATFEEYGEQQHAVDTMREIPSLNDDIRLWVLAGRAITKPM